MPSNFGLGPMANAVMGSVKGAVKAKGKKKKDKTKGDKVAKFGKMLSGK